MLQTLKIENVALIKSTTIEFDKGLNILLGETGAGKSLIFNSLLFVLGAKADKSLIRNGEQSMRVEALFADINEQAKKYLSDSEFDYDGELLISRSLFVDGKSSIRINGMIATTSMLKGLALNLVDSYEQHENVELLNNKNHILLLDKFIGESIENLKIELAQLLTSYKTLNKELQSIGGDEQERERLLSILKFQYDEISNADLKNGEMEDIKERLKVLNSAEKIFEAISSCETLMVENSDSVLTQLQEMSSQLSPLSNIDNIARLKERLDSARYELEDINSSLDDIKNSISFDERELEQLDSRYDLLKNLCKKYGGSIDKVLQFAQETKEKLEKLEDSDFLIEKLNKEKSIIMEKMQACARQITSLRSKAATEIESKVGAELKQLGMKSAIFKINISQNSEITSSGFDDVKFTFSANVGQEVKDLSKTASGGELSRFMLAVKNVISAGATKTLLFDEIDSGISGEIGKVVGVKLKNISKDNQVICITHLPQVASFGDNFINVYKVEEQGQTFSKAQPLQENNVVEAIAKMISGNQPSLVAINHVIEMIDESKKLFNNL